MRGTFRGTTRRRVLGSAVAATAGMEVFPVAGAIGAVGGGRDATVRMLLDRNHELHPEYGNGLANHFSMGLRSLEALGGATDRIKAFADSQWSTLEPLPKTSGPIVSASNWRRFLGRREALPGLRRFLSDEVAQRGSAETLRRVLPIFIPGIGAGAFHALIRTAYGVRFEDDKEVVDGLAYWAIAFLPLGSQKAVQRRRDPIELLEAVAGSSTLSGRDLSGHLISGKMKTASALPGFDEIASALAISEETLKLLARASSRLYVATKDFTALHMVTGTNAFRTLMPYLDSSPSLRENSLKFLWQAFVAAYVTIGAPAVREPASGTLPKWTVIVAKAVASIDEHDLKLVDIAREEETYYRDSIYRRVAARRMRLI